MLLSAAGTALDTGPGKTIFKIITQYDTMANKISVSTLGKDLSVS